MENFTKELLNKIPKIGQVVISLINNLKLFNLYDNIQLDFTAITTEDILELIVEIGEEQYSNLFPELGRDILFSEFGQLSAESFANYYHNNPHIDQIIDIQLNYLIVNYYTVNYNNKHTLFAAVTYPTADNQTLIYKLH